MQRLFRISAVLYGALGLALWPLPLFGLLHAESSAVVAGAGFFIAGVSAVGLFRRGEALRRVLAGHLLLLVLPWALLTATLLWRPNCGYAQGLLLFVLFTVPSVVLGVALAYALAGTRLRRPRMAFAGIGLLAALAGVVYDLGFHPQLYSYSHVFGGVLGPIYDEELAVRPGVFAFRALTLLWAVALVLLGRWLRLRGQAGGAEERRSVVRAGGGVVVAIVLAYVFAVPLGMNTSEAALARVLSEERPAGPFVLHWAPESLAEGEVAWMVGEARYRYAVLSDELGVAPERPIHVYLYPDPATRAALIGSRQTSVTPVWLSTPQIHMLADRFTAEHFGHELAHVFGRAFGMPVLRASPAVGLVEGLAVAVAPSDGLPSATEQVAATLRLQETELGALEEGPAEAVTRAMSPVGFWTGRGTVSYATTGAFTRWLLDRYGAGPLRQVYRTANFEAVYGTPVGVLAEAWEADLRAMPVSPAAAQLAAWRFAQPSLFERRCPHYVPPAVRLTREGDEALERGEGAQAREQYRAALDADSGYVPALIGWARRALVDGEDPADVIGRIRRALNDTLPDPSVLMTLGDAQRLAGTPAADTAYVRARAALPPYAAASDAVLRLRAALPAGALRLLLDETTPEQSAAGLERFAATAPAAWLFAAARWQEAGRPVRALAALEQLPPAEALLGEGAPAVERQRLAWLALSADRTGRYEEAARYAEAAALAFRAVGASGPEQQMVDLRQKGNCMLRAVRGGPASAAPTPCAWPPAR